MTYVFLGTESVIGPHKLDRFGQRIELTEELGEMALLGGCDLIPEEEFVEFFPEEPAKFAYPAQQSAQTKEAAEFRAKKAQAVAWAQARRAELEGK